MTDTGRRGLSLGLFAVLAVVGVVVWYLQRGGQPPASVGAPNSPAPATADQPPQLPTFEPPMNTAPEPLVAAPDTATHPGVTGTARPAPPLDPVAARGRVVWAGGALPENVDVTLFDSDGLDVEYTSTDEKGEFELRCADPLLAGWSVGTDELILTLNGAVETLAPALASDLPRHLPTEAPVLIELTIGFAPVLTGRVTDKVSFQPLAEAEVYVSSSLAAHALNEVEATTDADGNYVLPIEGLPLQGLLVWCRRDDYQTVLSGPLDLQPAARPGDASRMDFELEAPVPLRGVVLDAGNGLPVEDAMVTIGSRFAAFADESDWEITDEDGSFAIEMPEIPVAGAWLLVNADGYAPAAVHSNGPWQVQEIRVGDAVTLSGTVADPAGAPVVGAEVRVAFDGDTKDLDNGLYDETWTDDKGNFELLLETVPVSGGLLRVEAGDHVPFEARLGDVAHAVAGDRYNVAVSLLSY